MHTGETAVARKGISYSRFSFKTQEAGDSLRRQVALAEQAAKEEGVVLDDSLTLKDKGISAYRGENWRRGNLGKFLDLVDAGLIVKGSVLIIEQVNRLSRMDWMEQVEQWKEILSRGIVIRTCVPPARYTRANMSELSVGCPVVLFMMLGHLESKQKSEWLRQAWGQKKMKAASEGAPHGRRCPAWVQPVTMTNPCDPDRVTTTSYVLHENHAQLIRQIYQWCLDGWGAFRIAGELNSRGVPTWKKKTLWVDKTVLWLLKTRLVLGEYQPTVRNDQGKPEPAGSPIPDYYPPVVAESTWLAAQASIRNRRHKGGRGGVNKVDTNLFTHIVFDAVTRRSLHCIHSVAKGSQYHYLNTDPKTEGIPYQAFEDGVLKTVAQLKPRDVDGRHEADALTAEVDARQERRTRLGLELNALDQQLREFPVEKWPKRVVARIAELEQQVAEAEEALRVAKEAANTAGRTEVLAELKTCVDLLNKVRGTVREASVRQRIKSRLPMLVEAIWVRVQKVHACFRYVHVRLYLRGGEQRYLVIDCGKKGKTSVSRWPLANVDFRAGDKGDSAIQAKSGCQVVGKPLAS